MSELKPRILDETNGLDYVLVGDYYIIVIELPERDDRPIGKWGWMHRVYLEEANQACTDFCGNLFRDKLKPFPHIQYKSD